MMWGTLKKDFGEFVSTVATDATDALQQLDQGLEGSGQTNSGGRSEGLALIDPDTGIPIEYDNDDSDDDDDIDDNDGDTNNNNNKLNVVQLPLPPTPDEATVDDMKEFLMTYDDVFLDPIITTSSTMEDNDGDGDGDNKAVAQAFLDTFDIGTKTEDIAALLELHHETLEPTFSRLTDQVEYSDFWKRYFYRIGDCDMDRLKANYVQYYEKYMTKVAEATAAAAKQQNAKTNPQLVAKAALSNMTNFLGGVVHRLVDENDADDSADEDEEIVEDNVGINNNNNNNATTTTTSATNRFGNFLASAAAVRNNTTAAVSNTSDDAASQDEDDDDDDEVELGWDDDDEDDDEADEDDDDRNDETVEFKDAEKEKLQEDLALAQEERDMLHKTVTMQSEEIKKLREAVQPAVVLAGADEPDQVKMLQMQLFEKDSELAALRAQLDDMKNDKDEEGDDDDANKKNLEAEVAAKEIIRLKQVIADKEQQVEALQASQKSNAATTVEVAHDMDRLKEEIAFKDQQILSLQAAAENTDQSNSAEAAIAAAAEARAEIDRLQEIVATKDTRLVEEVRVADQQASELRLQLETFQSEKERAENLLRSQIEDLQRENEALKLTLSKTAAEDEAMVQKQNEIAALQESLDEARMALESRVPVEDLNEARQELVQSQSTVDALRLRLEQTTTMLKERETELQQQLAKRPSSPGSSSTGIKVVSTDAQSQDDSVADAVVDEPPVVQKVPATTGGGGGGGGDEDDGWGDDW